MATQEHLRELKGGCSCGRNNYIIHIPSQSEQVGQVIFSNSQAHRRSQATPLSAWLRVPLSWYQSSTHAYMEDETHSSIRRVYTSPSEQSSKRHFCGFCGTPLSYWSESPASEAEYICLTLGSLSGKDLRDLEELGLLPKEALEDAEHDREKIESVVQPPTSGDVNEGLPWFDSMVEGSRLGRVRKSWGERKGSHGHIKVEWEIMEWTDEADGDTPMGPAKRKIGEVVDDDKMQH